MSEIKLLPCPFCDGENVIETYMGFLPVLQCNDCRATMTFPASFRGNYKIELAKKWNTRKPMERIVKIVEDNFEEANQFGCGGIITDMVEAIKEEGGIE